MKDHGHTIPYTLTTWTPALPLFALLVISVVNFYVYVTGFKLSKLSLLKDKMSDESIKNLRVAKFDNFYEVIAKDHSYERLKHLSRFLQCTLGTECLSNQVNECDEKVQLER